MIELEIYKSHQEDDLVSEVYHFIDKYTLRDIGGELFWVWSKIIASGQHLEIEIKMSELRDAGYLTTNDPEIVIEGSNGGSLIAIPFKLEHLC